MTDINPILRAPIFLRENIRLIAGSAILVWIGMITYWLLDPPEDRLASGAVELVSVILGLILGHRAYRLEVIQPIGTAFGVAWRIGLVWVVLAALGESVTGDALVTMSSFPLLLLAFIVMIAGGFILGYMAGVFWSGVRKIEPQNLIAILLALAGIVLTIFFGSRNLEQQNEQIKQLKEQVEQLTEKNNSKGTSL